MRRGAERRRGEGRRVNTVTVSNNRSPESEPEDYLNSASESLNSHMLGVINLGIYSHSSLYCHIRREVGN